MATKKKTPKTKKPKTEISRKALEQYMPLVNSIASMVSGKGLPPNIDFNDLVSDGVIGLMKAWDNFDPTRGVKFETYASYRIRGEILDGLKNYNPVPYRVQVMIRNLAKKGTSEEEIEKEKEALEKKNLSEKEFKDAVAKIKKIVSASALMYLLSLEAMSERAEVHVPGERGPTELLEFTELRGRLRREIENLPPLEKEVVDLFYRKEMTQKDIASKLKLSRSKVNRVLGKAMIGLKEKLK
jgi:RNA polymerase sigma factor for flagellar operon FliA